MIKKIIAIIAIILTSITLNAQTPTRSQLQVCSNGQLAVNCSYFDNKSDSQSDISNPKPITPPTRSTAPATNPLSDYRIGSNSNLGSNSRVIPDYGSILGNTSTNTVKVSKTCIKSIFNRCPATNKPITPIKPKPVIKPTTNTTANSACSISTSRTTLGSNLTNIQPKTPVNANTNTTSNLGIANNANVRIPTSTQRPTSQNLRNCPTNTTAKSSCVKALTTSGKTTVCFDLKLLNGKKSMTGEATWYSWEAESCGGCAGEGITANGTNMKMTQRNQISTGAIKYFPGRKHPLGIDYKNSNEFMLIKKSGANESNKDAINYVCVKIDDTGSFYGIDNRIVDLSPIASIRVGGFKATHPGITAWNGAGICK